MDKADQVLTEFRELFNKMAWLNKTKMERNLSDYKPSEVHCIEYIGNHQDANVTKLAESLYMTRSASSKITKKLLAKELIERYQNKTNKKEIYFRLTEKGKKIYQIHEQLHEQFRQRDQAVFAQVTEEEFNSMMTFIYNYNQHLDMEIKKQGIAENLKK